MVVLDYDKKWPEDFSQIKTELLKAISVPAIIQHVGSTSIPALSKCKDKETPERG